MKKWTKYPTIGWILLVLPDFGNYLDYFVFSTYSIRLHNLFRKRMEMTKCVIFSKIQIFQDFSKLFCIKIRLVLKLHLFCVQTFNTIHKCPFRTEKCQTHFYSPHMFVPYIETTFVYILNEYVKSQRNFTVYVIQNHRNCFFILFFVSVINSIDVF